MNGLMIDMMLCFEWLLSVCRGDRIRTCDTLLPKQVRYRAALHPEKAAPTNKSRSECESKGKKKAQANPIFSDYENAKFIYLYKPFR